MSLKHEPASEPLHVPHTTHRKPQVDGPMLLTGYSAINKLLGKEVYTSQDQLGGPQVT